MRRITPVSQYNSRACVYACLEMVSFGAKDQREIHREMKKHGDSTDLLGECRQLVRMGILPVSMPFTRLELGGLFLVTVPSLNLVGVNHRVVIDCRFDENELFDPNEGRDGVKVYSRDMSDLKGFSEVTKVIHCFGEVVDV